MVGPRSDAPPPLPEGSRLLYVGPPKTGTTSLQEAARTARAALREHGTFYPGTGRNHRAEVLSLLGEPDPMLMVVGDRPLPPGALRAAADRVPPQHQWADLMSAVDAENAPRVMVTHEYASMASDEEATTFVRELGRGRTHVAITLRPLWAILVSHWAEELKIGVTDTLEQWLERLDGPPDDVIPERMRRYLDQAGLVERWARAAGPEHVTVIVVDKADRDLLTDTFEHLLGLPEGTLTGVISGGRQTNRLMSLPEAQVFRRVNAAVIDPGSLSWPVYLRIVRTGAINHVLDARTPGPDEPRVQLPEWAAARASHDGREYAERIAASGVQIVGDLEVLGSSAPPPDAPSPVEVDTMREIAVESIVGAVSGGARYERELAGRLRTSRKRLQRQKTRHQETTELLEAERAARRKAERRLSAEVARHTRTRARLDALQKRTLADQVRRLDPTERPLRAAESFTTHDLVRATLRRLGHRVRTGRSMRRR